MPCPGEAVREDPLRSSGEDSFKPMEEMVMELPQYVTREEVQRVCKVLGLRDWTVIEDGKVLPEEAAVVLKEIDTEGMKVPVESFRQGLEVELEHGTRFNTANVTNNHPVLTGMIVLAHLKETLDYYDRLEVAELEGDLLKAAVAGNADKMQRYFKRLMAAKLTLSKVEAEVAGE